MVILIWLYISLALLMYSSENGTHFRKAQTVKKLMAHLLMVFRCMVYGPCGPLVLHSSLIHPSFYAPGSNEQGHIAFVLSVCLFVCCQL